MNTITIYLFKNILVAIALIMMAVTAPIRLIRWVLDILP